MYRHMDFHVCKLGEVFPADAGVFRLAKMMLLGFYDM